MRKTIKPEELESSQAYDYEPKEKKEVDSDRIYEEIRDRESSY